MPHRLPMTGHLEARVLANVLSEAFTASPADVRYSQPENHSSR